MALAIDIRNELIVDTGRPFGVRIEGEGAGELPADRSNLVVRSMSRLAEQRGTQLPEFFLTCVNRIPLERGLGSSASAVVGGMLLADRLVGDVSPPSELLELAAELEGHADNVAAALLGGFSLAYRTAGRWRAERVEPTTTIRPVVFSPEGERVRTDLARRSLGPSVAREDATFNASRTALLVHALSRRPELLPDALEDRLHQEARLALAPASKELFHRLRAAGVPVCVAGSGPALLAFETDGQVIPDPGPQWQVIRARIADGAEIVED